MNIESLANHLCFENIFNSCKNDDGTYNWMKISKIENLPVSFIDKYFFQIYRYGNLEKTKNLSVHIIKKYGNHLNWNLLLLYQDISDDLLIKFKHKIDGKMVALFQNPSINVLLAFKDKISLKTLEKNKSLNKETINLFKKYLNESL